MSSEKQIVYLRSITLWDFIDFSCIYQ